MWTPEFEMKHLKKAEGHIGLNVVIITIKNMLHVREKNKANNKEEK